MDHTRLHKSRLTTEDGPTYVCANVPSYEMGLQGRPQHHFRQNIVQQTRSDTMCQTSKKLCGVRLGTYLEIASKYLDAAFIGRNVFSVVLSVSVYPRHTSKSVLPAFLCAVSAGILYELNVNNK